MCGRLVPARALLANLGLHPLRIDHQYQQPVDIAEVGPDHVCDLVRVAAVDETLLLQRAVPSGDAVRATKMGRAPIVGARDVKDGLQETPESPR